MANDSLPAIPEKLYFTIGEVGRLCDLRPHVLRYWEQEFPQLSPSKRRGNRRYYQRKDVMLIRKIKHLLYQQGFTIDGARQQLVNEAQMAAEKAKPSKAQQLLHSAMSSLQDVLTELEAY